MYNPLHWICTIWPYILLDSVRYNVYRSIKITPSTRICILWLYIMLGSVWSSVFMSIIIDQITPTPSSVLYPLYFETLHVYTAACVEIYRPSFIQNGKWIGKDSNCHWYSIIRKKIILKKILIFFLRLEDCSQFWAWSKNFFINTNIFFVV